MEKVIPDWMLLRSPSRGGRSRGVRWKAAALGGIALALGLTSVTSATQNSHNLASPPPGVSIYPTHCTSKTLHEKLEGWVCKTDYNSVGFAKNRLQVSAGFKNAHSTKKYYLIKIVMESGGNELDRCDINGWLGPGSTVECSANAAIPSTSTVRASFTFEAGNEGWPATVTLEV